MEIFDHQHVYLLQQLLQLQLKLLMLKVQQLLLLYERSARTAFGTAKSAESGGGAGSPPSGASHAPGSAHAPGGAGAPGGRPIKEVPDPVCLSGSGGCNHLVLYSSRGARPTALLPPAHQAGGLPLLLT